MTLTFLLLCLICNPNHISNGLVASKRIYKYLYTVSSAQVSSRPIGGGRWGGGGATLLSDQTGYRPIDLGGFTLALSAVVTGAQIRMCGDCVAIQELSKKCHTQCEKLGF